MWEQTISYDETMATYWENQLFTPDAIVLPVPARDLEGSVLSVELHRTVPAGVSEDSAFFTVHFAMRPGVQGLYDRLIDSDAAAVESSFQNDFWNNVSAHVTDDWTVVNYIWRNYGADYPLDKNGVSRPGPIWRRQPATLIGSSTSSRLPDQCASTTTLATCSRRHWGRFYVGGIPVVDLTSFGRLGGPYVDALSAATRDWFNHVHGLTRQIDAVVWSAKYRGIFGVQYIGVDDVVDIVRRRRAKFPTYRAQHFS